MHLLRHSRILIFVRLQGFKAQGEFLEFLLVLDLHRFPSFIIFTHMTHDLLLVDEGLELYYFKLLGNVET